jgi:2-polyprenyl-3-methyl-5-hydroxy-6-metoxy-1,4-benzoquinol methylase
MIEVKVCPCCGGESWNNPTKVKDHSISHETFTVITCSRCRLTATSPRPDTEKLSDYYQSEVYISHSGSKKGLINQLYLFVRAYSLRWKHQLINKLQEKSDLLDFGCGTGEFMQHMKKNGWRVTGLEPNEAARTKAQANSLTTIYASEKEIDKSFDVITLWHVLEHLIEPDKTIALLKNKLNPGGVLIIAVPNHWSFDGQHYGQHWAGYDVPRHLWHFNQKSMVLLLQHHGLHVKQIIPMKLDAYYVSMLSEQYKKNGAFLSFIKGMWYGFHSNLGARQSGEYSSLIYIAST